MDAARTQQERGEGKLVTAAEVARVLGVCRETVWAWARRNAVPCYRVGWTMRFDLAEVRRALAARGCRR